MRAARTTIGAGADGAAAAGVWKQYAETRARRSASMVVPGV
jgi:hypothetical protein